MKKESIQDRSISLIYKAGIDDLVRNSDIGHVRWKNVRHRKTRISSEELEVLQEMFPSYRLWLISGEIAPDCGQTSPAYDEANEKLPTPNAG